jgi:hypothetical protein
MTPEQKKLLALMPLGSMLVAFGIIALVVIEGAPDWLAGLLVGAGLLIELLVVVRLIRLKREAR